MKVTNEIPKIITTLMTIYAKHRHKGLIRRPRGADWKLLESSMRRLLVCRGDIPASSIRLPFDPWELFLSEFGPRQANSSVRRSSAYIVTAPMPPSILVSASSSSPRPGVARNQVQQQQQQHEGRRIRFAPLVTPRRQEMGGTAASRPIPRCTA